MSKPILFTILIVGASISIYLIHYFSQKQKVLRALSKFKFRKITQFQSNEPTKTIGKVLHVHEPFIAPFSRRKCVAFHITIEQKEK